MATPNYTDLVGAQRQYFLSGTTRSVAWRREQLEATKALLGENRDRFFDSFTNARGVLYHSPKIDPGVRYPPYSEHQRERAIESELG